MAILIKNGTLITASETFEADIVLKYRMGQFEEKLRADIGRESIGTVEGQQHLVRKARDKIAARTQ